MEITVVSWQISHLTRCHRNTFYFRLTLREMIRRRRRTAFFKKRKKTNLESELLETAFGFFVLYSDDYCLSIVYGWPEEVIWKDFFL